MIATILAEAEEDLEQAFDYHELRRSDLGVELVEEFRHGIERILEHPNAWKSLDATYRQYRLHRFPYGIIYRIDTIENRILIVAVSHLSRKPGWWRQR